MYLPPIHDFGMWLGYTANESGLIWLNYGGVYSKNNNRNEFEATRSSKKRHTLHSLRPR